MHLIRLLQWARATRVFLVAAVANGALTAIAVVVQAFLLADISTTLVQNGQSLTQIAGSVQILAGVIVVRAGLSFFVGSCWAQLPAGLETRVGRCRRAVFGGQRQRIALFRALVGDPAVVMADEPTEHLDAATVRQVMNALHQRCAHRILMVITHRNEAARSCGRDGR